MPPATSSEFQGRSGNNTRPRRAVACNSCRMRKVRCDGERPCTNCLDHDTSCIYMARQRTRQKKADAADNDMAERLARVEALLQAVDQSLSRSKAPGIRDVEPDDAPVPPRQFSKSRVANETVQSWTPNYPDNNSTSRQSEGSLLPNQARVEQGMPFVEPLTAPDTESDEPSLHGRGLCNMLPSTLQSCHFVSEQPEATLNAQASNIPMMPFPSTNISNEMGVSTTTASEGELAPNPPGLSPEVYSVYAGDVSNWEYHGKCCPRSFLSICSPPGIQWVSEKTCSHTFQDSATMLTKNMSQCSKMEMKLSGERTPEPSVDLAWKYTRAYFKHAPETAFELVNRAWFESRLESHLSGPTNNDDPAWFALRNAIYASGARIELAKLGKFSEALQTAWYFFLNCLSVQAELLYFQTSLTAIQALIVMGYFSEGIGNPCLEYMLSVASVRLVFLKGLHRQPVPSWNMSQEQQELRNHIFWAAYCLEKNCSARASRPSMIDDDHISCRIPDPSDLETSSSYRVYSIALIRLAQVASLTSKKFSSLETMQKPQNIIVDTIKELEEARESLRKVLDRLVDLDSPLEPGRPGSNIDLQQAIYIRMAYHLAILDIHAPVSYPWSLRILDLAEHPQLQVQSRSSAEIVVQTSRKMILGSQFIRLDASTSALSTVETDLSLIDIGVAHFLRLELLTESKISLPFSKDLAKLAQQAVKHSKAASQLVQHAANSTAGGMEVNNLVDTASLEAVSNFFNLDLENCSTFLPGPEFDDYSFNFTE
ncbi:hypothetical protein ACJZ2D_003357 [Fusarium nematophilum]